MILYLKSFCAMSGVNALSFIASPEDQDFILRLMFSGPGFLYIGTLKGIDIVSVWEPLVPPMESDPALKEYRCPHCGRFLFKGNVKRLNMVCHHCHKMISKDGNEFIKPETDAI